MIVKLPNQSLQLCKVNLFAKSDVEHSKTKQTQDPLDAFLSPFPKVDLSEFQQLLSVGL